MVQRTAAAQATFDRFHGRAFAWGQADCARMVAFHLRKLGLTPRLAPAGSYRTALSARRALTRAGHDSLAAALDALGLERIAPAAALVGDVLALPGEDALGALVVALGNGRVLGWHPDAAGAEVLQPLAFDAAWRVL
jgi:hypothetical protein